MVPVVAVAAESTKALVRDLADITSKTKGPAAVTRLVEMGSGAAGAASEVTALLKHAQAVVRARAATVLGEIKPETAQPLLKSLATTDADDTVKRAAVAALSDEGILLEFAQSPQRVLREPAAGKLAGSPKLAELAKAHADREVRGDAVFALADRRALAEISTKDADAQVRRWAATAMAADPRKELKLGKATCRVTPVGKGEFAGSCKIPVSNDGAAAYDEVSVTAAKSQKGWPATLPGRFEPGDRKDVAFEIVLPDEDAAAVDFEVVRAAKYRPAKAK